MSLFNDNLDELIVAAIDVDGNLNTTFDDGDVDITGALTLGGDLTLSGTFQASSTSTFTGKSTHNGGIDCNADLTMGSDDNIVLGSTSYLHGNTNYDLIAQVNFGSTAGQGITNNLVQPYGFTDAVLGAGNYSVLGDTGNFDSSGGAYTVQQTGLYSVQMAGQWNNTDTDGKRFAGIQVDNSGTGYNIVSGQDLDAIGTASTTWMESNLQLVLYGGDVVRPVTYQNSGSTINYRSYNFSVTLVKVLTV